MFAEYKKTLARIRRWLKVMRGPPPRKHGVIPVDIEPLGLPANKRPYRNDDDLMLRPGDPYEELPPAVQLKPIPQIEDASRCINCAGWKPQPPIDPLELCHD